MPEKLKVILIAGSGRSGSTVLGQLLERTLPAVSGGELRHFWRRGVVENQLCGCGLPFQACLYWRAVWERCAGLDHAEAARVVGLQTRLEHIRNFFLFLLPGLQPRAWREMQEDYARHLMSMFRAIQAESGTEFIVDSSKLPQHAFLLNQLAERGDLELHILHLVRDSRAVAYSWQKQIKRPEIYWKEQNMPVFRPAFSAWNWSLQNGMMAVLGIRARRRYFLLRYEDFVQDADQTVAQIGHFVGADPASIRPLAAALAPRAQPAHTVSGNPMRFEQGPLRIRLDDDWKQKLAPGAKRLVTLLSLPLLLFYQYL